MGMSRRIGAEARDLSGKVAMLWWGPGGREENWRERNQGNGGAWGSCEEKKKQEHWGKEVLRGVIHSQAGACETRIVGILLSHSLGRKW